MYVEVLCIGSYIVGCSLAGITSLLLVMAGARVGVSVGYKVHYKSNAHNTCEAMASSFIFLMNALEVVVVFKEKSERT